MNLRGEDTIQTITQPIMVITSVLPRSVKRHHCLLPSQNPIISIATGAPSSTTASPIVNPGLQKTTTVDLPREAGAPAQPQVAIPAAG